MASSGPYVDMPIIAELYDFTPLYRERGDVDFYLDQCRRSEGPCLELGCGTGRILIPAVLAGCRVTGLDSSPNMLDRCRAKLEEEPEEAQRRARLVQSDMTDFDTGETYSLVTAPFRSLQHLISVEEQLACLACANRHLPLGGRLAFDVFQVNLKRLADRIGQDTPEEESFDFENVELPDGRKFSRANRIYASYPERQLNDVELVFHVTSPDGRRERLVQRFLFRYYHVYEVEHLLARCGFEVVELFGDFDRSSLTSSSPEMVFVAEKRTNIEG